MMQGLVSTAEGEAEDAVRRISSALAAYRSSGATLLTAMVLSYQAKAYARLARMEYARRCIDDATTRLEATNERWCEADILRIAGEIAAESREPDAATAEVCFNRALAVARRQGAALARSRASHRGARAACAHLRLVHGGLRDARSEAGEKPARRARGMRMRWLRRLAPDEMHPPSLRRRGAAFGHGLRGSISSTQGGRSALWRKT
jgi:predicted ATPase